MRVRATSGRFLLAPVLGLAVLGLLGIVTFTLTRALIAKGRGIEGEAARPQGVLRIEPEVSDLTDRLYRENELVRTMFRVKNTSNLPVTIRSIIPSCSSAVVTPDDRPEPPFVLGPEESAEFWLRVEVRPGSSRQAFSASISAECDGRALPPLQARVLLSAEDLLKAYPSSVKVPDARLGEPVRRRVVLYTEKKDRNRSRLSIRVSNAEAVVANFVDDPESASDGPFETLRRQATIDLVISPESSEGVVEESLEILDAGEPILTIPVQCAFLRPYRLTEEDVEFVGHPGEVMEKTIYYESRAPEWNALRVTSCPEWLSIEIEPFDSTTRVVRLKARGLEAGPGDAVVVLTSHGGAGRIELGVRFTHSEVSLP